MYRYREYRSLKNIELRSGLLTNSATQLAYKLGTSEFISCFTAFSIAVIRDSGKNHNIREAGLNYTSVKCKRLVMVDLLLNL